MATNTRVRDLIKTIAKKLDLSSADGYSIFAKVSEKVHDSATFFCQVAKHSHVYVFQSSLCVCVFFFKLLSLADTEYFFDSLRQIVDWSNKNKRIKEGKVLSITFDQTAAELPFIVNIVCLCVVCVLQV